MDTSEGSDLAKVQARRVKHKARGINGNGFGKSLSEKAQKAVELWPSPMAGAAGTEDYNPAGNSDFSRKEMEQAEVLLTWAAPQARDHFPAHSPERIAAMKALGHGMRNLNDEAAAWRSPSDLSKRGGSQAPDKRMAGGHTINLEDQAEHWSTPKASNGEKGGPNQRGSKGDVPLPGQAVRTSASVAWPATRDHKGSSESSLIRKDGKVRSDMLDYAAEQFFQPPNSRQASSPDRAIAGGSICSTAGPNSNQPSVKRKLNPLFVEALMRWPTGLSGFARQEMAWTPYVPRMRSYLSALASGFGEQPEQMDLFA
jgi:hypothetical protein